MKICIPTVGNKGLEDIVNDHFGGSSYYTVIDDTNSDVNIITNDQNREHGNCSPAELIVNSGAKALICKGMGRRAFDLFSNYNIDVYLCNTTLVKDTIEMLKNNKLPRMSENDGCAGHQHHNC